MSAAAIAVLLLAGSCTAGSGVALIYRRRAVLCGCLLVLTGLALAAAGLTPGGLEPHLVMAAGLLLGPLAATTYPRPRYGPVELILTIALTCAGTAAVFLVTAPEGVAMAVILILVASFWWRIERTTGAERTLTIWAALVLGTLTLVALMPTFVGAGRGASLAVGLMSCLAGPALALGMIRTGVVEVRALVAPVVATIVLGTTYVASFALVMELFGLAGIVLPVGGVAATGFVVALGIPPLRAVLRGVIDDILFGRRPRPLAAATQASGAIGDDPAAAITAIRDALVLPYAALVVDGRMVAETGDAGGPTRNWPLPSVSGPAVATTPGDAEAVDAEAVEEPASGREVVAPLQASLVIGLRSGDLRLGRDDEDVLRVVAPLLSQTLRAAALAADLQEARGRAVAAIADERRRLRRDLHDGLGPRLSGMAFTADAARNLVGRRPDAADELLSILRADAVQAITDVRGIVEGLRPPALDELGLIEALRQRAEGLRRSDGAPLPVALTAADLPTLPAAVEVSAYWLVIEALTNVARHVPGARAEVAVELCGDDLVIVVTDNGTDARAWPKGIGTSSMRERAAEVGGTLAAGPTERGGRVEARLPASLP